MNQINQIVYEFGDIDQENNDIAAFIGKIKNTDEFHDILVDIGMEYDFMDILRSIGLFDQNLASEIRFLEREIEKKVLVLFNRIEEENLSIQVGNSNDQRRK